MQTVLAGPDGQTPAIDMATQKPLTMEEMLRRRGIVAVGNNVAMMGPQAATAGPAGTATVDGTPKSATAVEMQARANGGASPAVAASTLPQATTTDPAATAADTEMQQLEAAGVDETSLGALEALGVVAAGTAAAYAAWRLAKGRGNGNGTAGTALDISSLDRNGNSQIIEGDFTEVPATRQVVQERRGALPAPQRKLGNASRSATARARAQQAASGSTNSGTIAAEAAPRTVREAPDAGLARTLGKDSKILEQLRRNPGLARLLATGL
jgi:hypothetical protein